MPEPSNVSASAKPGFGPLSVAGIAITAFMVGLYFGSVFLGSAPTVPAPASGSQASGLPPGHPSIDPSAGTIPAPPLTQEQLQSASTNTSSSASSVTAASASQGFDLSYDDPGVRSEIESSSDFESLVRIGDQEFDAKHPKTAISAYEKALKMNPNNPDVITDLGVMYRAANRTQDAIRSFKKAAAIDPKHQQSRYNLGLVLWQDEGDAAGATKAWEDYLRLDPNSPKAEEVKSQLAKMKSASGKS